MDKKRKYILSAFFPVIVWSVFIFLLSSRRHPDISEIKLVNIIFFNFMHIPMYAILSILSFRGMRISFPETKEKSRFLVIMMFILFYGISDEIHQSFIPGRDARLSDVIIDITGGFLGWIILKFIAPTLPLKLKNLASRLEFQP